MFRDGRTLGPLSKRFVFERLIKTPEQAGITYHFTPILGKVFESDVGWWEEVLLLSNFRRRWLLILRCKPQKPPENRVSNRFLNPVHSINPDQNSGYTYEHANRFSQGIDVFS
jgi:hypothetical protein